MTVKIEKLTEQNVVKKGVKSWPVWEKEISNFPWTYEETEECYILEGNVTVIDTNDGSEYFIKPGDFVTFPKGMSCTWEVKSPVRKHYNFI